MGSLKKNFGYNLLLTTAGYIFPFLTFPYISRVLGANNIGIVNFVMGIVDYFVLFSTLGVSIVGMREIARNQDNFETRTKTFSSLLSLHLFFSIIAFLLFIICIYIIPQLSEYKYLLWIAASKIILNVFLVEWLFKGMQNFKYITFRTLITRSLYVLGVFVFVRHRDDYDIYLIITILQILVNVIINWRYSKKYIAFSFSLKESKTYLYPLFSWGMNMILLSFYTTFNVIFLGFSCGSQSVGYYTTATKLYSIILSVLQAYNGVFIPYLNTLRAKGDMNEFLKTIEKSFNIVFFCTIPLVTFCFVMAPEIVYTIAGAEYANAILPFRIVLFQVIIIGISQITNSQILLSLKKDKDILISTIAGSCVMVLLIVLFVPKYAEIAAAWAVLISHIVEFIFLYYFAKKNLSFKFSGLSLLNSALCSLPIICICFLCRCFHFNYFLVLLIAAIGSVVYYILTQFYLVKNSFVINIVNKVFRK